MRSVWLVAVLVCLVCAGAAWSQAFGGRFDARQMGMGGTSVALQNGGSQWSANPAGLGQDLGLGIPVTNSKCWLWQGDNQDDVIVAGGKDAVDNAFYGLTYSGLSQKQGWGFGAGYGHGDNEGDGYGAGLGVRLGKSGFSFGANWQHCSPDWGSDTDSVNLGLLWQAPGATKWRVGFVARDVNDGRYDAGVYDLGFAIPVVPSRCLVSVDILDLGDWHQRMANFGFEAVPFESCPEFSFRGGLLDNGYFSRPTIGLGYKFKGDWRLDASWLDSQPNQVWQVNVAKSF
jgi:hypothetical protein